MFVERMHRCPLSAYFVYMCTLSVGQLLTQPRRFQPLTQDAPCLLPQKWFAGERSRKKGPPSSRALGRHQDSEEEAVVRLVLICNTRFSKNPYVVFLKAGAWFCRRRLPAGSLYPSQTQVYATVWAECAQEGWFERRPCTAYQAARPRRLLCLGLTRV